MLRIETRVGDSDAILSRSPEIPKQYDAFCFTCTQPFKWKNRKNIKGVKVCPNCMKTDDPRIKKIR